MKNSIILFALFITCCSFTFAHGELTLRIKEKTEQISQHPKNAVLYFERGYLYEQHHVYTKALKDYKKANKLGYKNNFLNLRISQTYFEQAKFKKALATIKSYYKRNSFDINAHKLEAQILYKLKRYKKSLLAHEYVFNNITDLRPNDVISYSEALLSAEPGNYKQAINILELGLVKLGPNIIALQIKKLEYLKRDKQVENTINLFNELIVEQSRKEFWYYKKAEFLYELGEFNKSNIALQQSIASIKELKLKSRNTESIKRLLKEIQHLETKLNS